MLEFLYILAGIVWLDLILSGDNALVIAMVANQLPEGQRRAATWLGTGAAIVARVIFAAGAAALMALPFACACAGLFLVWVAVKLALPEGEGDGKERKAGSLLKAVGVIAAADVMMSADNAFAVAALAKGNPYLIGFGVVLSIPLMVACSAMIGRLLTRFPWFKLIGAAVLLWVAGGLVAEDAMVREAASIENLAALKVAVHVATFILAGFLALLLGWPGSEGWADEDKGDGPGFSFPNRPVGLGPSGAVAVAGTAAVASSLLPAAVAAGYIGPVPRVSAPVDAVEQRRRQAEEVQRQAMADAVERRRRRLQVGERSPSIQRGESDPLGLFLPLMVSDPVEPIRIPDHVQAPSLSSHAPSSEPACNSYGSDWGSPSSCLDTSSPSYSPEL